MLSLNRYSNVAGYFPKQILCPRCGSGCQVLSSDEHKDFTRENWVQCLNKDCKWFGRVVTGESLCN